MKVLDDPEVHVRLKQGHSHFTHSRIDVSLVSAPRLVSLPKIVVSLSVKFWNIVIS